MKGRTPIPAGLARLMASTRTLGRKHARAQALAARGGQGRPVAPRGMKGDRKAIWLGLVELIDGAGCLAQADAVVIELLAVAIDRYRRLVRAVDERGDVVEFTTAAGTTRRVVSPEAQALAVVQKQIVELSDRLGLNPVARARVGAGDRPEDRVDFTRPRDYGPPPDRDRELEPPDAD